MIEITPISEKDYSDFIAKVKPLSFLQDYEWGEVEKSLNREVFRFGIFKKELIGVFQLIGLKAKRGDFLALPHGPILINSEKEKHFLEIIQKIISYLKGQGINKNFWFLRCNFLYEYDEKILKQLRKIGFRLAPRLYVTENFWIKKTNKNLDELLEETSDHHKRLIKEALEKDYLEIESTQDKEKLKIFLDLYHQLAISKQFTPYPNQLIEKEFEIFTQVQSCKLYLGKVENKYLSSALIIFKNKSAYYHHGASIPVKEPINYKLHWQIIKEAKERGCEIYNFWGITEEGPQHPWYGLTKFKKGFGGELIKLLPTLDYPFSMKYYFTYLYEKLKNIKAINNIKISKKNMKIK